jgi:hypothetical protein
MLHTASDLDRSFEMNKAVGNWWKPEGKKQLERHKHRWEHNIKMHFNEIGSLFYLTLVICQGTL